MEYLMMTEKARRAGTRLCTDLRYNAGEVRTDALNAYLSYAGDEGYVCTYSPKDMETMTENEVTGVIMTFAEEVMLYAFADHEKPAYKPLYERYKDTPAD